MKTTIYLTILILAAIILWRVAEPGNKQYNKYMCAVYGYYEDCKTPLRKEDRLK